MTIKLWTNKTGITCPACAAEFLATEAPPTWEEALTQIARAFIRGPDPAEYFHTRGRRHGRTRCGLLLDPAAMEREEHARARTLSELRFDLLVSDGHCCVTCARGLARYEIVRLKPDMGQAVRAGAPTPACIVLQCTSCAAREIAPVWEAKMAPHKLAHIVARIGEAAGAALASLPTIGGRLRFLALLPAPPRTPMEPPPNAIDGGSGTQVQRGEHRGGGF